MSTFTQSIKYGTEMSAAEFIVGWAKLRGGFAHMRDEPLDAPIRMLAMSPYRESALKRAKENLEKYKNMTLEEAEATVEAGYQQSVEHQKLMDEKRELQKQKFVALMEQVNKWEPPTLQHLTIKEDALSDLKSAIKDCECSPIRHEKMGAQEYIDMWVEQYEREVAYQEKALAEEKQAIEEKNKWITALLDSVEKTYAD
ncbi:hypothetical protein [Phage f2b1]|nr:hypothetical protein [Phage f2b1]